MSVNNRKEQTQLMAEKKRAAEDRANERYRMMVEHPDWFPEPEEDENVC